MMHGRLHQHRLLLNLSFFFLSSRIIEREVELLWFRGDEYIGYREESHDDDAVYGMQKESHYVFPLCFCVRPRAPGARRVCNVMEKAA